jgi:hypothetical protein
MYMLPPHNQQVGLGFLEGALQCSLSDGNISGSFYPPQRIPAANARLAGGAVKTRPGHLAHHVLVHRVGGHQLAHGAGGPPLVVLEHLHGVRSSGTAHHLQLRQATQQCQHTHATSFNGARTSSKQDAPQQSSPRLGARAAGEHPLVLLRLLLVLLLLRVQHAAELLRPRGERTPSRPWNC